LDDTLIYYYLALIVTGLISGFINTIAGGGTMISVPALMLTNMPADIANATNRLSIFLAALVSVKGFDKHGHLPRNRLVPIIFPTLIGSLLGAISASYTPAYILKYILLTAMVSVALWMLLKPKGLDIPEGTQPITFKEKPIAWFYLFLIGIYGGFVQAGIGFILILALSGYMRFDLLKSNAIKVAATLCFTSVALFVFIIRDQIDWVPGLVLSIGSMIGAYISVKFAISVSKKTINRILFVMVTIACIAAALK
jgi:uncharacterized membrane protein YfcA